MIAQHLDLQEGDSVLVEAGGQTVFIRSLSPTLLSIWELDQVKQAKMIGRQTPWQIATDTDLVEEPDLLKDGPQEVGEEELDNFIKNFK